MLSRMWRDRRVVLVSVILLLIGIAGVSLYIVLFWVDYDHEFAVLAFYGLAPSAGYSITVRQVQRRDVLVIVRARFVEPPPNAAESQVLTYPNHVIAIHS